MAPRHPDPFEDVRLDERFVRSARFLEPSARERTGQLPAARGVRCTVVPAPRGLHGLVYRLFVAPPRPAPRARRLTRVVAVLTLGIGMISLTFVALRHTARGVPVAAQPLPASAVSAPGGPAGSVTSASAAGAAQSGGFAQATAGQAAGSPSLAVDPAARAPQGVDLSPGLFDALRPGDCLAWPAQPPTRLAPEPVNCAERHLDEVTQIVDLAARFGLWPGAEVLSTVAAEACADSPWAYARVLDVAGHGVASVRPDRASWERGVHGVACTVRPTDLVPRAGRFVVPPAVRS
ncbi:septum formation family protein [Frankia sp. EI5c]|uniref:SCO2583/SCO2584 N-terminal domain-containing protein n=1 Tax=Frankia sp. EI5c TaxID=683316 RepID=UPI0008241350|nr:septum formation family protein [Frankia sp. EI5c]